MNSKSFAFLSLLATLTTTLPAWADVTIPGDDCPAELRNDVTIDDCGPLTVSSSIDLKGYKLTLKGVTTITWENEATFTSDSSLTKTGELWIAHSGNVTQKTAFSGKLKFIKDGEGTFIPVEKQTYEGGTEIRAGEVASNSSKYSLDNAELRPYGDIKGRIAICNGGRLNLKRFTNWGAKYPIDLHGGQLVNDRNYSGNVFNASEIKLHADSTYVNTANYGLAATFDLNGHTLIITNDYAVDIKPVFRSTGTVVVSGKQPMTLKDDISMPEASLKLETAVNLNGKTWTVWDYEYAAEGASDNSGTLIVNDVFKPTTDSFFPPMMKNGSKIDLSNKDLGWSATGVAFESGATVTIDVGERSVQADDQLVTWSAPDYTGCTFELSGTQVEGLVLGWDETGVVVQAADKTVTLATWSGAAGDGDVTNPENWMCKTAGDETIPGRLPDSGVAVTIPYEALATINCPVGADLVCKTLTVSGGMPDRPVTLTADRDWRGLGAMDIPFELDLKGHKLYILLPGAESTVETTVKSSVEGGELHASVAAGKTYNNTKVTLTDNLMLVKEGEGVFVQSNTAQSYTGGTRIEGGVLATPTADLSAEGVSLFGTVNKVTVAKGGALDPRGSYNWSDYTIVLDGGMISNTVANIGTNNDNTQYNIDSKNVNRRFNPNVTLLDNSTFATTKTYTFFATVDSDGHTLQNWIATDAEVRWQPKTKTGGKPLTMDVTGGGELFILKNCSLYQPTMTLKMTDGWVTMGGDMVVSNYVAASEKNLFDYRNVAAVMKVFGTFAPQAQRFIGCTMQNGSTIDLSEKKDVWSTQGFAWGKGTVDFATGATVTIDASGRELSEEMKIVEWAATPTNLDGLTFKLDEESKADGYRIKKDDAGLFVEVDTRSALTMDDVKKALPEGVVLNGETNVFTGKTAAEINEIMNTSADNGLTVKENLILGIEQEKNGKFEKKPFLKADAGAQTKEDTITFSFGGIDPKFDKADITYLIESATSVGGGADAGGWEPLMSDKIPGKDASATVELPKQDEPAVKYYRVTFEVSEKAVSGDPANQ